MKSIQTQRVIKEVIWRVVNRFCFALFVSLIQKGEMEMVVGNESDQVERSLDFKCGMTAPLVLFRRVEAALSKRMMGKC